MKGITFNAEMIRALADGRKTQTRRPIKDMVEKPDPECYFDAYNKGEHWNWWYPDNRMKLPQVECPYGKAGDRLFCQEEWGTGCRPCPSEGCYDGIEYKADEFYLDDIEDMPLYKVNHPDDICLDDYPEGSTGWQPAKLMPEWASRYTIEITDIRVEKNDEKYVWVIEFRKVEK